MDLHAVELVLQTFVTGARRDGAGVLGHVCGMGAGAQPAGAGAGQGARSSAQVTVSPRLCRPAPGTACQTTWPCGGRVRAAQRHLADVGVFKRGDVALPDVQVEQVDARSGRQFRLGQDERLVAERQGEVVLDQDAVHVGPATGQVEIAGVELVQFVLGQPGLFLRREVL